MSDVRSLDQPKSETRHPSSDFRELLEAADLTRRLLETPFDGVRDFRDVEVSSRIERHTVRRHELPGLLAAKPIANTSEQVALQREDAHTIADVGHRFVHL